MTTALRGERGSALLEFALSAPLFATLIIGVAGLARVFSCRYQLSTVTHAVMREVAGGTTNEAILTALANGYAKAGSFVLKAPLAVTVEPAVCGGSVVSRLPAGPVRDFALGMAPGTRVRVRGVVPLSGLAGSIWRGGFPVECTVVVLTDPWKGPWGRAAEIFGGGPGRAGR